MKRKYKIASPEEADNYRVAERSSGKYDWSYRHRYNVISNFLPNCDTQKNLLDFGCGDGSFIKYLLKKSVNLHMTGYDPYLQESVVASRPNVKMCKSLKGMENKFDIITSLDVIEHIQDDKEAMLQINKLMHLNGLLLLTVPAHELLYSLYDAEVGHYRRYSKHSIFQLLQKSGFSVQHFTYFYIPFIPVALILKIYKPLRKMWEKKPQLDVPTWVSKFFSVMMDIEFKILCKNDFYLPFGHSIFIAALKEE